MFDYNPILDADSYKMSHFLQYPPGTEVVHSYIESRGGRWPNAVFFGLQAFLKRFLSVKVTQEHIDEAAAVTAAHGVPFNLAGWQDLVERLDGVMPVTISAVREGSVVGTGNVLLTIQNTDPAFFWLPSYLETALLRAIWYGTTVATNSWTIRHEILTELLMTVDDPQAEIGFKLHDFGARAATSFESAGLGGMAHLVSFQGSDTISGIMAARRYYDAEMPAFSIPGAEHSTITAWGSEGEVAAYSNMLAQFAKPGSIVAVVSDSYDLDNAVDKIWGGELRQAVIASGATVVIRPDSGDPVDTPIRTIETLAERFGFTTNRKGYKVLNNVRVIQGDSVDDWVISQTLKRLRELGFSATNIVFGMGGKLLQADIDRDTLKFAMKTSALMINGRWHAVQKSPKAEPWKKSKLGRQGLIMTPDGYKSVPLETVVEGRNQLIQVWENGTHLHPTDFDEVRTLAGFHNG